MDPAELYRLPPEDFTAARDAAAKQARADGDAVRAKEIKALRRPSTAAWLVDLLAVEDPALLEELLALGPALAEAQAGGSGDALRELGAQRRQLVGAVTDRAVALAGRSVTSAVREEVAGTLEAALADPASADAVRSGRLVRALSYAGFGGVDLAGAVADAAPATSKGSTGKGSTGKASTGKGGKGDKGSTGQGSTGRGKGGKGRSADEGPDPDEHARRAAALAAAEADALAAAGALDDAVRGCERLAAAAEQAAEDAAAAQEQVARARDALAAAERTAAEAEGRQRAAEQQSRAALDGVRDAQQQEGEARRALDRLRRHEEKA